MRAGELRHRVTIQAHTQAQDSWGTPLPGTWADLAQVWADLRHLGGVEAIRAGADTSMVKASCRIRWRDDVTAGHRVLHDGKVYDIEAVLPDARRQFVDLVLKTTGQAAPETPEPEPEEPPYNGGWG